MVDQRALLNGIWEQFRVAGVSNHLAITEHIAAVLLEINGIVDRDLLTPEEYQGSELDPSTSAQIRQLIVKAAGNSPQDAAELLDPLTLFREAQPGFEGEYPTPRHLVALMHRVCEVRPEHAILDLACGSGGFLTHLEARDEPDGDSLGVEIARGWARIAYANTRLRFQGTSAKIPAIQNGNALRTDRGSAWPRRFDRVLMNPPFGTRVDRELLKSRDELNLASTADVELAKEALDALKADGCAGILLPKSLFGVTSAESALRRRLLESHHLRAVVALPQDTLQPFSGTPAYLVVVDREPMKDGYTWFFALQRDGYPSGRSRDLTGPPTESSDFPLVEAALGVTHPVPELDLGRDRNVLARVAHVHGQVRGTLATEGVVIQANPGVMIQAVEWHTPTPDSPRWAVPIYLERQGKESLVWLVPNQAGEEQSDSQAPLVRSVYEASVQPGAGEGGDAVVVTAEGELLGRRVPTAAVGKEGDLRPEVWVPRSAPAKRSPPVVVAGGEPHRQGRSSQPPPESDGGRMPESQAEPRAKGESTRDAATVEPHAVEVGPEPQPDPGPKIESGPVAQPLIPRAAARPEPFAEGDADELEVFGALSPSQERVYNAVRALPLRTAAPPGTEPYQVVSPFCANDLEAVLENDGAGGELHPSFVDETLSLFEAMGILMRAHVSNAGIAVPYCRLATPWDKPAPPTEPGVQP